MAGNMMSPDTEELTLGGLGFEVARCQPWHAAVENFVRKNLLFVAY